jgi:hypothetical protein
MHATTTLRGGSITAVREERPLQRTLVPIDRMNDAGT